jgi:hypothetical protein
MIIKTRLVILVSVMLLAGCEKSNQELYDEVMQVHDEVMPKMEDLYKAKVALKARILDDPDLPESEKKEINDRIAQLDSAGDGMMVWMRQFNPLPDSLGEEKARQYLQGERQKVQKVKEDILQALKDAESKTPTASNK